MREFITGNQAVVRGALKAGCNFVAGYPITPASSILSDFLTAFSDGSGIAIQTEDEIAAIGQCIGASMAGAKALTATSGPGLSLYSENIGLAQMGEVPLVIVDCQRMGPATGGATASGEGDILFARHVTAGGYPLPVLAATNAATAYRLTCEAFNIAERLRTPVILLLSKDISLTRQTTDLAEVDLPPTQSRPLAGPDKDYQPYAFESSDDVPRFSPIGGPRLVRFTGSIHDEKGILTIDRKKIYRKLNHLRTKIVNQRELLELSETNLDNQADTLLISYGLADGAAREAVEEARSKGSHVTHLTLYSLWPVPEVSLRRVLTPAIRRVVIPELNIGLYADELRKFLGPVEIKSVQRFDGGPIQPQSIVKEILQDSRL